MDSSRSWLRYTLVVGLAIGVAIGVLWLTPAEMLATVEATYNGPSFLAILFGLYLLRPFVAGPVSVFTIVVGIRYGVVPGVGIALLGTVLTCLPPYLAGRYLRTDIGVLGTLSTAGTTVVDYAGDFRGTIAGRLSPAPADTISYGAGIAGVRPAAYLLGTTLGEIPWTVGFILIGTSMDRLGLGSVDRPLGLFAIGTLGATLLLAPPLYRRFRRSTGS